MRRLVLATLCAFGWLGLAGCAVQPTVSPAEEMAMLPTGAPLLRCRDECLMQWRAAAPRAAIMDREGRWRDLALLLLSVGYQDDLTLHYLARAALGMGYPQAAVSYYKQSLQLSGTTLACRNRSGICGGLDLPALTLIQLSDLERRMHPPPERRRRHLRPGSRARQPEPAESAVEEPGAETRPMPEPPLSTNAAMPPPPLLPTPAESEPVQPPPPGAADFIEPPPAR